MQGITTIILAIIIFGTLAYACFWLFKHRGAAAGEKFPVWRLLFLAVTYSSALWFFFVMLFFGESSGIAPERSTFGHLLQGILGVVGIYLFLPAPIGIIAVGIATVVERGNSIYHRIIYWGCAGYAFFLIAFFVLAASRCSIPPGGIP